MKRIKVLNAHKRNEAFDELYEESRADREEQLSVAIFKRQIMEQARQGLIDLNSEEIQKQLAAQGVQIKEQKKCEESNLLEQSEKLALQQ